MRIHLKDQPTATPMYPVLGWIPTPYPLATAYKRPVSGSPQKLEFEYCFDNELFFNKFVLEDWVTGFALSQSWQTTVATFNRVLPDGVAVSVVIGMGEGELLICILGANTATGKIRKVKLNGAPLDTQPLSASLAEMDILLSPTNTQLANQIQKPEVDVTPITTRLGEIETKLADLTRPPVVNVPRINGTSVLAAAQVPIPAVPTSQPIATANLGIQTWVITQHSDGVSGEITGGIHWRIVWVEGGYDFHYQGVADVGNPWVIVEKVGAGSSSRSISAIMGPRKYQSRTFTGYTLEVKIPGGSKTFTVTRPRADVAPGWLTTRDTRLGLPVFLYVNGNAQSKVIWGRSMVYLLLAGVPGDWVVEHWLTTDTLTQQTVSVVSGVVSLVECSGADRIQVRAPGGEQFTCYKPGAAQTWAAIEQPLCDVSQQTWTSADISLGAFCYREWRKANGHYVNVRYSPNTQIEVYTPGLTYEWIRLTRSDGTQVITKPTLISQFNEVFALIEIWIGSSASTSLPATDPTIVAPIAVLPTQIGIPDVWRDYLAWLEVADTALGKAIVSLRTQQNTLVQKIAATQFDTGVEWDTGFLRGSKKVYTQCYTGTIPNNTSDNLLFKITGATQVLNYEGYYKQPTSNRSSIFGISSGSNAHGPILQFYTNEAHWYNVTGDVRWQSGTYWMRVWYIK